MALQESNMSNKEEPDEQDAALQPFTSAIGDVQLAEKLFGHYTEITWLKNTDWDYSCMTLTRDGEIRWKDEDKYDHDTTTFVGNYTLEGTEEQFTVIGHGDSTAHYDAYRGSPSSHFDKNTTTRFESARFTGPESTVTYK
jgi:hypothetical protein